MRLQKLYRHWFGQSRSLKHLQRRQTRQRPRIRLRLEALEDRVVPAMFDVNSLLDLSLAPGVNPDGTIVGTTTVTLRSAIQAANSTPGGNTINLTLPGNYQITLAPTTPNESDNLAGEFAILPEGDLTITNTSGGAVTVSGGGQSRVFDINPADTNDPATHFLVTMQGFTITGGKAFDATGTDPDGPLGTGGGIRDQGNQDLTLTNMVISNNTSTSDGGVSMENDTTNSQWTLTINASTFTGNNSADAGSGVETDGSGNVVINTSTVIRGNTSVNGGGGVFLDDVGSARDSANLNMTGVLVSDNSATDTNYGLGGGISNAGNGAVVLTNCTVASNFAAVTGGGFSDEYSLLDTGSGLGTLSVVNSTFVNNLAATAGNSISAYGGGGIFASGTSVTFTNSGFQNNTSGTDGGAVFDAGVNTLTIAGSTFANNTAIASGGGLELQIIGSGTTATITNSTLTGNTASTQGGGIDAPSNLLNVNGTLTLLNDTINSNFSNNGGGIFWGGMSGSATVQNTIIAQNTASTAGPDANNNATGAQPFTDAGGNLIGIAGTGSGNTGFTAPTTQTGTVAAPLNPLLAALANNGGPTIGAPGMTQTLTTEALQSGSPALNKGVSAGAPTTDERGFARPDTGTGELPDVGAFEFQDATLAVSVTPQAPQVVQGNTASFLVTVTNTGANALPASGSIATVTLTPGLSATSPLTFPVGPLATGQKIRFTVTATATAVGTQTATVVVTSPDTPASAANAGSVSVIPTAPPMTASIQFVSVAVAPNLFALNQTETIDVHISSPGGVNPGTVTFTVAGQTVNASVDGNGDAVASLTLPLSSAASPQSISAIYSGANDSSASATQTALWMPWNALLPSRDTFAADGSQAVQSYLGSLPLLDFLYTPSGQLSEVVFGSNWLSWEFVYFDGLTVVRLNGVLPVMVF